MNDDKLPATRSTSEARDPAWRAAERGEFEQAGQRATRHTVGVYDRPAQRAGFAGLSLPLLVIMILAALVSVVVTARFLF